MLHKIDRLEVWKLDCILCAQASELRAEERTRGQQ